MIDPDLADDLRTFAEVSVTLAGFAAIAGVIELRSTEPNRVAPRAQFVTIFVAGIEAALLAFLPLILLRVPFFADHFWRWSHMGATLANVASFVIWYKLSFGRISVKDAYGGMEFDRYFTPIGIVFMIATLAVSLGFLAGFEAAIYLLFLYWLLFIACFGFGSLISRNLDMN